MPKSPTTDYSPPTTEKLALDQRKSTVDSKKGFTLIELMVAITILAIIAGIGLTTYASAQIYARDAKRKEDLSSIQIALDLYYQTNGHYPTYPEINCASDLSNRYCTIINDWEYSTWAVCPEWLYEAATGFGCIKKLDTNYISSLPVDPINGGPLNASNGYVYYYKSTGYTGAGCPGNGKWFVLKAQLENANDKDSVKSRTSAGNPYKWCDGTNLTTADPRIYDNTYLVIGRH